MIEVLAGLWLLASAQSGANVAVKDRSAAVADALDAIQHGLTATAYQHHIALALTKEEMVPAPRAAAPTPP